MSFIAEVKALLKETLSQLTPNSTQITTITFSHQFDDRAKTGGFTRKEAEYIYHHGQPEKENTISYQHTDRKIGISYYLHKNTGKPVITGIFRYGQYKKSK
jgi:hypothetical protein